MKPCLFTLLLLATTVVNVCAQKALSQTGYKVSEDHVYFSIKDDGSLEFFQGKKENNKPIEKSTVFLVKDNFTNLYFEWKNPLKYRITWKDSTYSDERDDAIRTFVSALVGQFGTPVTGLNIDQAKSDNAVKALQTKENQQQQGDDRIKKDGKKADSKAEIANPIEIKSFNSIDLTLLYIHLREGQKYLTEAERISINKMTVKLTDLDAKITYDYGAGVDELFAEMIEVTDVSLVPTVVKSARDGVKKYNKDLEIIKKLQTEISSDVNDIDIKDALLDTYFKSVLPSYLKQTESTRKVGEELTKKLEPVIEILDNSVKDEADRKGYYKAKVAKFDDGKVLTTAAEVSVYDYDSEKKELKKSKVATTVKITFRKYDWITPFASAGVFYSDVEIPGYSLKNEDGKSVVRNDTISRNSAVVAAFLNLNFSINSRYFSPLLQIGTDPTKTRPYLLIGGGFTIPVARFGLSAGPIWTFQPQLDKLKVGEEVASEVDLQNDIRYRFKAKPIGWYFGVIYNF